MWWRWCAPGPVSLGLFLPSPPGAVAGLDKRGVSGQRSDGDRGVAASSVRPGVLRSPPPISPRASYVTDRVRARPITRLIRSRLTAYWSATTAAAIAMEVHGLRHGAVLHELARQVRGRRRLHRALHRAGRFFVQALLVRTADQWSGRSTNFERASVSMVRCRNLALRRCMNGSPVSASSWNAAATLSAGLVSATKPGTQCHPSRNAGVCYASEAFARSSTKPSRRSAPGWPGRPRRAQARRSSANAGFGDLSHRWPSGDGVRYGVPDVGLKGLGEIAACVRDNMAACNLPVFA